MESAITHGRYSTYTNHGCRCDECREAWRIYSKDLRERRRAGSPGANLKSAGCRARAIAVAELISRYQSEYDQILLDAREREFAQVQGENVDAI